MSAPPAHPKERYAAARRAEIICEELAKPRAIQCRCAITPDMTVRQLKNLGAGCMAGDGYHAGWVCDTLAAIRRRIDA